MYIYVRMYVLYIYMLNHSASNTPKSRGQHGPTLYPCLAALNFRYCWLDKSKEGQTLSHYLMTYSMLIATNRGSNEVQLTTPGIATACCPSHSCSRFLLKLGSFFGCFFCSLFENPWFRMGLEEDSKTLTKKQRKVWKKLDGHTCQQCIHCSSCV